MLSQLSYAPICICAWALFLPLRDTYHTTTLFICQYLFESFFEIFKKVFKRAKSPIFTPFEQAFCCIKKQNGETILAPVSIRIDTKPALFATRCGTHAPPKIKASQAPTKTKYVPLLFPSKNSPYRTKRNQKQRVTKKIISIIFHQNQILLILQTKQSIKHFHISSVSTSVFPHFLIKNEKFLPLYI